MCDLLLALRNIYQTNLNELKALHVLLIFPTRSCPDIYKEKLVRKTDHFKPYFQPNAIPRTQISICCNRQRLLKAILPFSDSIQRIVD